MNLDIGAAVDRCMEISNSHSEITIDVVMTNSFKFESKDYSDANSL